MLDVRDDLFTVGRFAREAWRTIRGDDAAVTEFPFLLKLRNDVEGTYRWLRAFAKESWKAITGGEAEAGDRFPWMQDARKKVLLLREDLKKAFAGDIGEDAKFNFPAVKSVAQDIRDVQRAWEDMKKVFAGDIGPETKFNFPGIQEAAQKFKNLREEVEASYATFKKIYDFIDGEIQKATLGKVSLGTIAMVSGLLTLFGVTRLAMGGLWLFVKAAGAARKAIGMAEVAAGGAAAAAAVAGAGGAAAVAGKKAGEAVSGWSKLKGAMAGVFGFLKGKAGLAAGLGGMAVENTLGQADTTMGRVAAIGGTAAEYAGFGAMLPGPGYVKAAGAVVGGLYGMYAGNQAWGERHEAIAKAAREKAQARPDDEQLGEMSDPDAVLPALSPEEYAAAAAAYADEFMKQQALRLSTSEGMIPGTPFGAPMAVQAGAMAARNPAGWMPSGDVYQRSSQDLYRAAMAPGTPQASAAPSPSAAPVIPPVAEGGDSLTINIGEEVLKIRGRFTEGSKNDLRTALQRIAGLPQGAN